MPRRRNAFFLVVALGVITLIPILLVLMNHEELGPAVEEIENRGPGHERALLLIHLADSVDDYSDSKMTAEELLSNPIPDGAKPENSLLSDPLVKATIQIQQTGGVSIEMPTINPRNSLLRDPIADAATKSQNTTTVTRNETSKTRIITTSTTHSLTVNKTLSNTDKLSELTSKTFHSTPVTDELSESTSKFLKSIGKMPATDKLNEAANKAFKSKIMTFHDASATSKPSEATSGTPATNKLSGPTGSLNTFQPVIQGIVRLSKSVNQEFSPGPKLQLNSKTTNHSVKVHFPKVSLLKSNIPCNQENNFVPKPPKNYSLDLHRVQENLQKCLSAAELTDYFHKKNFTRVAETNARHFVMRMREIVPSTFSATHGNNSCWESNFTIGLCGGQQVQGHIDQHMFQYSGHLLSPGLQRILHYSHYNRVQMSTACIPSVFVAGFPKCGSSFVYCLIQKLYRFSNLKYFIKQSEKEPHFWVPGGPVFHHRNPHDIADLSRYIFNSSPQKVGNNTFAVPIDGSPNTMFQWPRYSTKESLENYCLVPSVLPVILPNTKYVVVLRDPVTMLYSAFWFSTSVYCPSLIRSEQIKAPDDFHHKVVKKIEYFKRCRQYKPVDACLEIIYNHMKSSVNYLTSMCGRVRMEVGFYYHYIRRWLAVIPRSQFLFITTEELSTNYDGVVYSIGDFLDLGLRNKPRFIDSKMSCRNVQSTFDYRHDPELRMRNDTRQLLYEFFEPFNLELATLLQDSKFLWKQAE